MRARASFGALRFLHAWVLPVPLLLFANVALAAIWTYPQLQSSQSRAREEAEATAAIELLQPALEDSAEKYGPAVAAQDALDELRRRIKASSGSVAELNEALRRLVDEVGLRWERATSLAEDIEELGLIELQTNLRVSGSYASVRELISDLQRRPAFVALEQVALGAPDRSGAEGQLTLELRFSAFVESRAAGPQASDPTDRPIAERHQARRGSSAPGDLLVIATRLRERLRDLPPLPLSGASYLVGLEALDEMLEPGEPPSRNLFSFANTAPVGAVPFADPTAASAGEDGDPQESPEPDVPLAPAVPFRLIGIVTLEEKRLGTFTDGTTLHLVEVGSELPGGFEVVGLGPDWAELAHGDFRTRLNLERKSR